MAVTLAVAPSFAPDTSVGASFGSTSAAVTLPGTPASDAYVRICNLGPLPLHFKLGTSSAVTVTAQTGVCVLPGRELNLTIGSNTYLAGCCSGGLTGQQGVCNLTTGN